MIKNEICAYPNQRLMWIELTLNRAIMFKIMTAPGHSLFFTILLLCCKSEYSHCIMDRITLVHAINPLQMQFFMALYLLSNLSTLCGVMVVHHEPSHAQQESRQYPSQGKLSL